MSSIIKEIQKNSIRDCENSSNEYSAPQKHGGDSPYSNSTGAVTKFNEECLGMHPLMQFWNNYYHAVINCVSVIAFYGVGIAWYHSHEKWSYLECIYFITVSCKCHIYDFSYFN